MYRVIRNADTSAPYVVELVADTQDDLKNIDTQYMEAGSTVVIIDSASVYMLNSKKEWVML